jgi:hypothetical protein
MSVAHSLPRARSPTPQSLLDTRPRFIEKRLALCVRPCLASAEAPARPGRVERQASR